jgi:hypothetical protein
MARICIVSPGQPSINPRLVKEADSLSEAGHEVRVVCSHYASWADEFDRELLRVRSWTCTYVGGDLNGGKREYAWTRLRSGLARRASVAWRWNATLSRCSLARTVPELESAAKQANADLYIAHYVGALVAAGNAAQDQGARLGFDAEDFESGSFPANGRPGAMDQLIERSERQYLKQCNYISAASPGIAEAYHLKYRVPLPVSILNVFPLGDRPPELRATEHSGPVRLYWFSQTIGIGRGLEDVLRAMGAAKDCDIELHLRGLWSTEHRAVLIGVASASGVDPGKIVAHPPAAPFEMVRLAAEYDIGLALEQPISENRNICLTNKLFTYLLAGNAVIATATKGQKPIMETVGDAGFCFEAGDIKSLAARLRLWCENRGLLQHARSTSWHWGAERFNWDIEKYKLLQTVAQVLGTHV